ncbi:MAG: hypothetical protein NCW75_05645 [Phycisphaera sp.]|nr:MAG: hypothetical protein NCW75_05645 [Phycisphaera sp.]
MPENTPTIGRVVHCNLGNVQPVHRKDPYPAIVVGVNPDGTLELNAQCDKAIYEGRGQTNVVLSKVPQGEPDGEGQRWWCPPREPALGTDAPQGGASDVGADGQAGRAAKPAVAGTTSKPVAATAAGS